MHSTSDSTVSPLRMYRPIRLTSGFYRAGVIEPICSSCEPCRSASRSRQMISRVMKTVAH